MTISLRGSRFAKLTVAAVFLVAIAQPGLGGKPEEWIKACRQWPPLAFDNSQVSKLDSHHDEQRINPPKSCSDTGMPRSNRRFAAMAAVTV
jgi:hypothetical protein